MAITTGNAVNCDETCVPKLSSLPERVTNIPEAVEINSAGN